nr:uncharacterized protein LOC122322286 [Drosophila bipectinata]XP_043069938.1 uncharacterized protein LOC122322287 [Drosophila bipectinata]XP_043069939.1 uncharacterized protein LOC122322288 [Drosophila bipectinata]
MLDNRMSYGAHVEYSTIKAARIQGALSGMLPNVGGPKEGRRRLLASVVTSVLLYAAPIWAAGPGFRTISEEAALVLAGMIPIDILANKAEEIYASNRQQGRNSSREAFKRSARQAALSSWQETWDSTAKGRWTHRLITKIQEWIGRNNGQVSYQLTQFLTGGTENTSIDSDTTKVQCAPTAQEHTRTQSTFCTIVGDIVPSSDSYQIRRSLWNSCIAHRSNGLDRNLPSKALNMPHVNLIKLYSKKKRLSTFAMESSPNSELSERNRYAY